MAKYQIKKEKECSCAWLEHPRKQGDTGNNSQGIYNRKSNGAISLIQQETTRALEVTEKITTR